MSDTQTISKAFDLFLYQQFEHDEPGFDKDDLPDVFEAWKDNLTDEQHNEYADKFSEVINKK